MRQGQAEPESVVEHPQGLDEDTGHPAEEESAQEHPPEDSYEKRYKDLQAETTTKSQDLARMEGMLQQYGGAEQAASMLNAIQANSEIMEIVKAGEQS